MTELDGGGWCDGWLLVSGVINVGVVTPDMSVMFCACQADKGDLLKQKLAPATIQWVFYGFVLDKNPGFYLLEDCWSSEGRFSPD